MTTTGLKNKNSAAILKKDTGEMTHTQYYEVSLLWDFDTKGIISSLVQPGKSAIWHPPGASTNKKEKWTPEHLFIVSVNSSLMSTFLLVAGSLNLEFISFESNAAGKIEYQGGKAVVTEILLGAKLVIPATQKETRAKKVLELSKKACTSPGAVKTKISLEYIIITK